MAMPKICNKCKCKRFSLRGRGFDPNDKKGTNFLLWECKECYQETREYTKE